MLFLCAPLIHKTKTKMRKIPIQRMYFKNSYIYTYIYTNSDQGNNFTNMI